MLLVWCKFFLISIYISSVTVQKTKVKSSVYITGRNGIKTLKAGEVRSWKGVDVLEVPVTCYLLDLAVRDCQCV